MILENKKNKITELETYLNEEKSNNDSINKKYNDVTKQFDDLRKEKENVDKEKK